MRFEQFSPTICWVAVLIPELLLVHCVVGNSICNLHPHSNLTRQSSWSGLSESSSHESLTGPITKSNSLSSMQPDSKWQANDHYFCIPVLLLVSQKDSDCYICSCSVNLTYPTEIMQTPLDTPCVLAHGNNSNQSRIQPILCKIQSGKITRTTLHMKLAFMIVTYCIQITKQCNVCCECFK